MSSGFIPTDPTTWTDFKDPAVHGFAKLDCNSTLESALTAAGNVLAAAAGSYLFTMLLLALDDVRTAAASQWLQAHAVAFVPGFMALSAVFFVARRLTDNFYLIDPARHAVYYHFSCCFVRRVELLLERKDIAAATVESQIRKARYARWWVSRAVLVDERGRIVPVSDWERDGLQQANDTAQELAQQLGVPWHAAPEQGRLVVDAQNGAASVSFEDYTWLTQMRASDWVLLGWGLIFIGFAVLIAVMGYTGLRL
jgi:hypothetical protein